MKMISENLGRIIAALAAIALLVCCVTAFRTDVSDFFDSVIGKQTAIGDKVLGSMDGVVLDPGNSGAGDQGGAGGFGGAPAYDHNAPELHPSGTIPEGAVYTTATGETRSAGAAFPEVSVGDVYAYGNYEYCYGWNWCGDCLNWAKDCLICEDSFGSGWAVHCTNDVANPGAIFESINGEPVTNMVNTFVDSLSLTVAPIIPINVTDMSGAFAFCEDLTTAPEIPNSVTNMFGSFEYCDALTGTIEIPCTCDGQNIHYTDIAIKHFEGCGH